MIFSPLRVARGRRQGDRHRRLSAQVAGGFRLPDPAGFSATAFAAGAFFAGGVSTALALAAPGFFAGGVSAAIALVARDFVSGAGSAAFLAEGAGGVSTALALAAPGFFAGGVSAAIALVARDFVSGAGSAAFLAEGAGGGSAGGSSLFGSAERAGSPAGSSLAISSSYRSLAMSASYCASAARQSRSEWPSGRPSCSHRRYAISLMRSSRLFIAALQVVAGRARPAAYILRRTGTAIRPTIG